MINVKHFMDTAEADDGIRVWVEPMGLTNDMRTLCSVDYVLPHLGPPRDVWGWFERHPQGYEYFRGRYHEHLSSRPLKSLLQQLANAAARANLTLLHQGSDPQQNTATALYEFLCELGAYCPPDL